MDDTTAASAGFVLVGLATAATLLSWPGAEIGAGLGVVALVVLTLRRYGRLERELAAVLAGAGALGVALVGLRGAFLGGVAPGAVLAALAGAAAAVFAYADLRGVGRDGLAAKGVATLKAVAIGAAGIVAIFVWGFIAYGFVLLAVPGQLSSAGTTVVSTVASGLGTLSVVVLYLRYSERGASFLDVRVPGLRGLAYAIGGTLAVLGGNLAIGLLFQRLGVESATHTVVQTAEADPSILLVLIPLSYLAIAPGEELLYRNVIQKSLRERFSPVAGVVVASAVFAAVHLPAYSTPGSSFRATLSTLVVIFVLALVLGALYERTKNVVVPILAHGTFNAIAFAVTYAQFTGQFAG